LPQLFAKILFQQMPQGLSNAVNWIQLELLAMPLSILCPMEFETRQAGGCTGRGVDVGGHTRTYLPRPLAASALPNCALFMTICGTIKSLQKKPMLQGNDWRTVIGTPHLRAPVEQLQIRYVKIVYIFSGFDLTHRCPAGLTFMDRFQLSAPSKDFGAQFASLDAVARLSIPYLLHP
jgi:hypothetical protein